MYIYIITHFLDKRKTINVKCIKEKRRHVHFEGRHDISSVPCKETKNMKIKVPPHTTPKQPAKENPHTTKETPTSTPTHVHISNFT